MLRGKACVSLPGKAVSGQEGPDPLKLKLAMSACFAGCLQTVGR